MTILNRRSLFKIAGAGTLSLCSSQFKFSALKNDAELSAPINRESSDAIAQEFSGDNPQKAHNIFWNLKDSNAPIKKETDLVIIGGGLSGLASAFLLRKFKPIILEQASRFGGNSKAENWRGLNFAIGAAYIGKPVAGTKIYSFLHDLDLLSTGKNITEENNAFIVNHQLKRDLWDYLIKSGDECAKKIYQHLEDVYHEKNGQVYPHVPPKEINSTYLKYEKMSLEQHLENICSSKLSQNVKTFLENYTWGAFAANLNEISATAGLNFLSGEIEGIMAFPGGNAMITDTLYHRLVNELGPSHLRANTAVTEVSLKNNKVKVTYISQEGQAEAILAKKVIFCAPKFIASKIIPNLSEERLAAMKKIEYRSFWVVNALFKTNPSKTHANLYEAFMLNQKKNIPLRELVSDYGFTDVINANFAQEHDNVSIFTLYQALPYNGARAEMLSSEITDKKNYYRKLLIENLLPALGIAPEELHDIRVTRWGHPLPVPKPDLLGSGFYDLIQKPIEDKIYFVNQDNWCVPSFEAVMGDVFNLVKKLS